MKIAIDPPPNSENYMPELAGRTWRRCISGMGVFFLCPKCYKACVIEHCTECNLISEREVETERMISESFVDERPPADNN